MENVKSAKNFYKWYYSLNEKDRQKELKGSRITLPYNTWDMNYHFFIGKFELLIDVCDVADELANINSDNVNDIECEQLIELAWKIYD